MSNLESDFYAKIYYFSLWENTINRKNTSKEESAVQYRTEELIKAFNNAIKVARDIYDSDLTTIINQIQPTIIDLRKRLQICLKKYDKTIDLPEDFKTFINISIQ